ncbi:RagB/SusD family nutrient uptake outer membrane protein [Pedobacter sp.]|uniref:RagB/SusD family nutrient uptake outer membrane protein n=1 Tax=Pedobacter sp. TaxID=1411316 RepID=UPI003D7F7230
MNYKYLFSVLVMLSLITTSCRKDFLEKTPEEDITIEEAFQKRNYAEAFLTDIYAGLPNEIYFTDLLDINPFVVAADEMNVPWPEKFGKLMNKGSWNSYNVAGQIWKNMYEGIRKANIFLKYIKLTPVDADFTQQQKDTWIGEAMYLRAFYHFQLMRIYGPVPILDKDLGVSDDFNTIRRQPLQDCVDFVVNECNAAMVYLPMKRADLRELGRPTGAAALAMKARVLLYSASPLWNGNPDYANFVDNNGTQLFPAQYDANKWQLAANAAKECIDLCEAAGYKLFNVYSSDPVKNYQQLFIENNNSEVLFARNSGRDGWMEKSSFPSSLSGWNGWNPTQGQVDAYEMSNGQAPITGYNANGTPVVNPASGYVETGFTTTAGANRWPAGVRNMYINRDPRFYATINFNGATFVGRQMQFWASGADGRGVAGRDYNTTGYLLKKFSDPTVNISQGRFSLKTWIYYRLGEIYLNYAEALNEATGPVAEVYKYVNAIRERAGMPALPAGLLKEEMRTRIRQERRIELAFETHRYFDTHRWKIAATTDSKPVYGMNIAAGTSLTDEAFYIRTLIETRVFQAPKHNLFPLPQSEIDKAPNIIQNPGW